jgi:hypothetical protein
MTDTDTKPADDATTGDLTDDQEPADVDELDGQSVTALDPAHEVEARSADQDKPSTTRRKVFVLGPDPTSPDRNPYTESKGYDHEPNLAALRQETINQGMWPTAPAKFVSAKRNADGKSWDLTYSIEVSPTHRVPAESEHPEVIADDTDKDGATRAQNADPSAGK